jgi:serine/threonine-protein phosphatase 2B regulatory subunit
MTGNNITEEQLNTIVSKTILDADKDGDSQLSYEEFAEVYNTMVSLTTVGV